MQPTGLSPYFAGAAQQNIANQRQNLANSTGNLMNLSAAQEPDSPENKLLQQRVGALQGQDQQLAGASQQISQNQMIQKMLPVMVQCFSLIGMMFQAMAGQQNNGQGNAQNANQSGGQNVLQQLGTLQARQNLANTTGNLVNAGSNLEPESPESTLIQQRVAGIQGVDKQLAQRQLATA